MGQLGAKYDTQLDLLFIDNEEIFGHMVIISSLGGSQLQMVVILSEEGQQPTLDFRRADFSLLRDLNLSIFMI